MIKNLLLDIKKLWESSNLSIGKKALESEILLYQKNNKVILPKDLVCFFLNLNGSSNEYDKNFFQFYSLDNFKKISDNYKEWNGIPNYKNIVNTLEQSQNIYVFADYNIDLFCYAIELHENEKTENNVYVICGDEYRIISNSFTSFINLYLNDSPLLTF